MPYGPYTLMLLHSPKHIQNKRAAQYQTQIFEILQPFSDEKFHFLKTSKDEDLLEICHESGGKSVIKVNISPVLGPFCLDSTYREKAALIHQRPISY